MPAEGCCREARYDIQNRLLDKADQVVRKKGRATEAARIGKAGTHGGVRPQRRRRTFRTTPFPGFFRVLWHHREEANGRLPSSPPRLILAVRFEA